MTGPSCVLDASALIAYVAQEPGEDVVRRYLLGLGCLIHAVNACEFLYLRQRGTTPGEARQLLQDFVNGGVVLRGDFDVPFLQIVADYKTAPTSTPLGDCFGLALAQREGLPFVTSDHGDMDRVQQRGTVAIDFIR